MAKCIVTAEHSIDVSFDDGQNPYSVTFPAGTSLTVESISMTASDIKPYLESYYKRPIRQFTMGGWKWERIGENGERIPAGPDGPDMTYWAKGTGKVVAGAGKLVGKGIAKGAALAKEAYEKEKAQDEAERAKHKEFVLKLIEAGFIDEYLEAIKRAEAESKKIQGMDMPKTPDELMAMVSECEKQLAVEIVEDQELAKRLHELGSEEEIELLGSYCIYRDAKGKYSFDDDTELDFEDDEKDTTKELEIDLESPAEIIHEGWQKRFDKLIKHAKATFPENEAVKELLKKHRFNTSAGKALKYIIYVGIGILAFCLIFGIFWAVDEGVFTGSGSSVEQYESSTYEEEMDADMLQLDDEEFDAIVDMYKEAVKNDDFEVISAIEETMAEAQMEGRLTRSQEKRWERLNQ